MARQKEAQAVECARQLGQNLTRFRARAALSQDSTAERAGLHRTEISLIERGLRVPRLDTIVKLAGALEVDPCMLLEGMAWDLATLKEGSR
jgi:transcriptional regulator with XRE-family HTH domain